MHIVALNIWNSYHEWHCLLFSLLMHSWVGVSIGSGDAGTLLWCENTLGDQGAIKLGSMHLPCIRRWTCNCKFLPKDNQHQQLYTILLSSMKCTFIQDKNMNHGNRKEVGHSSVSWMQKETTSTKGHYLKIPPLYTEDKTVLIWPCGIPRSNCLLVAGHHPVVTSPSTREETKIDCLDSKWGERGWASIRINVSKICGRCCPLLCVLLCYIVLLCYCVTLGGFTLSSRKLESIAIWNWVGLRTGRWPVARPIVSLSSWDGIYILLCQFPVTTNAHLLPREKSCWNHMDLPLYLTQFHPHFLGSPPLMKRFQTSCQDSLLSDSFDMVPLTNGWILIL